jgi:predicted amidohydrolase
MKKRRVTAIRWMLGILVVSMLATSVANALPGRVALVHSNPTLGDLEGNIIALTGLIDEAFQNGADVIVAPELATTGYSITRQEVEETLGLTAPYPELNPIRDLAMTHNGYVVLGIAETSPDGVFNSAVVFGPDGYIKTQQKRSLPLWHDRGQSEITAVETPFGDMALLVCADSWLPDLARIATLDGADFIVVPANWWGYWGQEETWQVRAQENGVWFFVANRWGIEIDDRDYPPDTHTYNMNDAPSVVINPSGEILKIHRAEDDPEPQNTILYQDIDVPAYRIGNALTPTYSVIARESGAYGELANTYYRRDLGYVEYPGLPLPGTVRVSTMAYEPSALYSTNLVTIEDIWAAEEGDADLVVLPALGVSMIPVDIGYPTWFVAEPFASLQAFVDENDISMLVTTLMTSDNESDLSQSILLMRSGQSPIVHTQIHDALLTEGSGMEPLVLDMDGARIGVLSGRDALFPEATTQLAKSGVDLLVISSGVGIEQINISMGVNYFSDVETLHRMWRVRSNEVLHVAASDWTGHGAIIENGGGYIGSEVTADNTTPLVTVDLDSSLVRYKYLHAYEPHDISALLGI